jgi:cation diffusion facilitator CzcD-associated flavoprotein CzcO
MSSQSEVAGKDIFIVGGGNSAGQALAKGVQQSHLCTRSFEGWIRGLAARELSSIEAGEQMILASVE